MSYADNILDAVDILIDKKLSNLPYDKTVRATIVEVVDESVLKYKVKYQNAFLFAYAVDADQDYRVDDEIYLQIPSNDFNKNPLIIGKVLKTEIKPSRTLTIDERAIIYGHDVKADSATSWTITPTQSATINLDFSFFDPIAFNKTYDGVYIDFKITSSVLNNNETVYIMRGDTQLDAMSYRSGLVPDTPREEKRILIGLKNTGDSFTFSLSSALESQVYTITDLVVYPVRDVKEHLDEYQGATLDTGFIDTREQNGQVTLNGIVKVDQFTKSVRCEWSIRDDSAVDGWRILADNIIGTYLTDVYLRCRATYNDVQLVSTLVIPTLEDSPLALQVNSGTTEFDFATMSAIVLQASEGYTYYWSYYQAELESIETGINELIDHSANNFTIQSISSSFPYIFYSCTFYENDNFIGQTAVKFTNTQEGLFIRGGETSYVISYDAQGQLIKPASLTIEAYIIKNGVTPANVTYTWHFANPSAQHLITLSAQGGVATITPYTIFNISNSDNDIVVSASYGDTTLELPISIIAEKPGNQGTVTATEKQGLIFMDLHDEVFYYNNAYHATLGGTVKTQYNLAWETAPTTSIRTVPFSGAPIRPILASRVNENGYGYSTSIAIQQLSHQSFYIVGGFRDVVYSKEGLLVEYALDRFQIMGGSSSTVWTASWLNESTSGITCDFAPPYYFDPTQVYTLTAQDGTTYSATIYLNFYMDRNIHITDDSWNGITSHNNIYYPAWSLGGANSNAAAGLILNNNQLQTNLLLDNTLINGGTRIPSNWDVSQTQIRDRNAKSISVVTGSKTWTLSPSANNQTKTFYLHPTTTTIWAARTQDGTPEEINIITGLTINTTASGAVGSFNFTINVNNYSISANNDTVATIYPFDV